MLPSLVDRNFSCDRHQQRRLCMVPSRHLAAVVLAFVGLSIVSAHAAWSQSCKREDQTSCTNWWWNEVTGGIPPHVDCPNGLVTCVPIIIVEVYPVNGYKYATWGWHTLAVAGPSPGRASYKAPTGCTCDAGTGDCICVYSPTTTIIVCPNLANPNTTPNCP